MQNISANTTDPIITRLQVKQTVELDIPPTEAWDIISDFARLQDWHPAIVKSEIIAGTNAVPGTIRHLTLANGATLDEMLTVFEPQNKKLEYTIVAGEFPASDYRSTLTVEAGVVPAESRVTWMGFFNPKDRSAKPAPGEDDATATATVDSVYSSGLNALESIVADRHSIRAVIASYAEGGTRGDREMVAAAFHPSASMKFVRQGELVDEPIERYYENYIPAGIIQARTVVIDRIDIRGTAAAAKLTIDYPTHQFIDFFNLLKIEGEWLVVGKIFHRAPKV